MQNVKFRFFVSSEIFLIFDVVHLFTKSYNYSQVCRSYLFNVIFVYFQLRQKSLARSIGVTLATNSLSAPSSPSKDSKSATLGPSTIRNMSRPSFLHPSSYTQEFRGRNPLSLPRGASSAAVSLPATNRHTLQRHIQSTTNLKKVHSHPNTLTTLLDNC